MPRFGTMARSKKSKLKRPTDPAGPANDRAFRHEDMPRFEDVGNQHRLLREDLMQNKPRVNAGRLSPIKREQEDMPSLVSDSDFDAIYAERPVGRLEGLELDSTEERSSLPC